MATLTITVPVTELDIVIPAFLASTPMPQIPDPAWRDPEDGTKAPMIDKYPTAKAWAEADGLDVLNRYYLRQVIKGQIIQNESVGQAHLTKL